MKANFNFQINSNIGSGKSSKNKKGMSPQEEYWLNRFLHDYAGKLILIFILFFVLLFGLIFFASSGDQVSTSKNININLDR